MTQVAVNGITYTIGVYPDQGSDFIDIHDNLGRFVAEASVEHKTKEILVTYSDNADAEYPYTDYTNPAALAVWIVNAKPKP